MHRLRAPRLCAWPHAPLRIARAAFSQVSVTTSATTRRGRADLRDDPEPSNVNQTTFASVHARRDDEVYAQPLYRDSPSRRRDAQRPLVRRLTLGYASTRNRRPLAFWRMSLTGTRRRAAATHQSGELRSYATSADLAIVGSPVIDPVAKTLSRRGED